jgi:hypothetical protein
MRYAGCAPFPRPPHLALTSTCFRHPTVRHPLGSAPRRATRPVPRVSVSGGQEHAERHVPPGYCVAEPVCAGRIWEYSSSKSK